MKNDELEKLCDEIRQLLLDFDLDILMAKQLPRGIRSGYYGPMLYDVAANDIIFIDYINFP